jgi:putative transposase
LTDRARTPYRYAHKLPAQLEAMIVSMRRVKPTWGARKLRERLFRKLPNDVRVPACSTIHAIMDRHRLVTRQKRSRSKTEATPLSQGLAPHALWCTDYKGEFLLGDKRYCYPLTVSDYASRYLLLCEARESVSAPTTACPLKLAVHPDLKMRRQAGQEFFGFRIHLYDKMVR